MSLTTDLKKGAGAYLYIFIAHDANMGNAIMTKRTNQIINLQAISHLPTAPSFDELVAIVRDGIVERYGMTPNDVLSKIYNLAIKPKVGAINPDLEGLEIDTTDTTTGTKAKTNFWGDVASVVEWIVKILASLGVVNSKSKDETTPLSNDWGNIPTDSNMTSAGIGTYLPYVFGAAIVYTLFTNGTKK
jgi:pyruvate/oxaloacetate carboxyltransferase